MPRALPGRALRGSWVQCSGRRRHRGVATHARGARMGLQTKRWRPDSGSHRLALTQHQANDTASAQPRVSHPAGFAAALVSILYHEAQSTRRVHGVLRHVLANGSASFQSHPNHANTFRPKPADRAIPHTKDLRAETGSFGAFKPNTFTCARFFFLSRTRERVWKAICRLRLLAFAEMIGREGSSRLAPLGSRDGRPVSSRETPAWCSHV